LCNGHPDVAESETVLIRVLLACALLGALAQPAEASTRPAQVRFSTFNASLNRGAAGQLVTDLSTPANEQARKVAEVIQRDRPDVLLINEFDYVPDNRAANLFRSNYLRHGQNGARPIDFPYAYTAPVNTGVPSGLDFNRDGKTDGPDDAYGFGLFPGQYGMLVLSKFPIDTEHVRTFQNFLWKDMPGALLPDDPATPAAHDWYSPQILSVFRLSSKSHWDLPLRIDDKTVHFLVDHPTPPSFDGAEDRNGTRNHDEIRLWADYITPGKAGYLYDDKGNRGGLAPGAKFVIAGDHNSDPIDGDSVPGAIQQLLNSPRLWDLRPGSRGAVRASQDQKGANLTQRANPWFDTGDFNDNAPGNLRVDYVLPSRNLIPLHSEVFWPTPDSPLARLNDTTDHHLVGLTLVVPTW
jgi:hypothetical protein